jgi:hypothetical protein
MTFCWSILIGARRLGSRRTFTRADEKRLQAITADHFADGYTILEARGGWFDPSSRKFVREASRQILVTSNSPRAVRAWAKALGAALHQKELLIVKVGSVRRVWIGRRRA